MKTSVRPLPLIPLALVASLLTAFLVLFAPLSASAHDALVASSPEADGTVDTLPEALTLTFSEDLIAGEGATEVVVTDAAGTTVSTGAASVTGAVVTQPLAAEAEAGVYRVLWKVVSSDGHPTSGEYSFTVTTSTVAPPAAEPTEQASQEPTAQPTQTPQASDPTPAPTSEDSTGAVGLWVLVAIGVLAVAAVVIVLFARRADRATADSSSPSER